LTFLTDLTWIFLSLKKIQLSLNLISKHLALLRKLSHTHTRTHSMSWVNCLIFLSAGKFVLFILVDSQLYNCIFFICHLTDFSVLDTYVLRYLWKSNLVFFLCLFSKLFFIFGLFVYSLLLSCYLVFSTIFYVVCFHSIYPLSQNSQKGHLLVYFYCLHFG
jgi:hypothetical protein